MTTITYLVGDALSVLRTLPDASVDFVLSSPPFLALRSYLPADHPDKAHEMGSEPTPGAFIDGLLDIVEECRRVLAPHGSLCFELGDTYAGSGGAGGDYNLGGQREPQEKFQGSQYRARSDTKYPKVQRGDMPGGGITNLHGKVQGGGTGWPLDKSLCLIPELLRFALAYGINPLTGRTTERWRVRNVVRWCRPNPPVGALADKVRPATSDILIACTGRKRYFDLDAVRGPCREDKIPPGDGWNDSGARPSSLEKGRERFAKRTASPTGAHIAAVRAFGISDAGKAITTQNGHGKNSKRVKLLAAEAKTALGGYFREFLLEVPATTGWTDCGHNDWRPGVVLDPFAGTGTTGVVAHGHGRSSILIDLDARNLELCRERFGPLIASQMLTALDSAEVPA